MVRLIFPPIPKNSFALPTVFWTLDLRCLRGMGRCPENRFSFTSCGSLDKYLSFWAGQCPGTRCHWRIIRGGL